jgi:hypothetical protein
MSDDAPQNTGMKGPSAAFRAQAGKGRPKGVPNKTTLIAKDAIAKAAEQLGGVDRLVAWAKEDEANERAFWATIYPKLLPLQVTGEGGGAIQAAVSITFRKAEHAAS